MTNGPERVILSEAKNLCRWEKQKRPFAALRVTIGLLLVMSAVARTAEVAPPRPWEFIVIHHSATRAGSAEVFDAAHRARGMINGLAYHFVIDNGTEGTQDGFIETGTRWVKQMHGGH